MRTSPALAIEFRDAGAPEQLRGALVDYPIAAVFEQAPHAWQVFFHDPNTRNDAFAKLTHRFPNLSIRPIDIDAEDWAARSQASLTAIRVGALIVAPPWDMPKASDLRGASTVVVIEPSTGFGTGHHATTRLCLAALQRTALDGASVLDVGTGSGILAIAASRLGASAVLAIDDDSDAIDSATRNVRLNQEAHVELRMADIQSADLESRSLVVANLTGALLLRVAPRLRALATPSGQLIVSGYLTSEEADVLAAFNPCLLAERTSEEEWACARLRAPASE